MVLEKHPAYVQGSQVWWDITIQDISGQPVDPGTLRFSIRKPNLTTGLPITETGVYTGGSSSGDITIIRTATGKYSALGNLDAAGEYKRRWEVWGGVVAVKQTAFEVEASVI